MSLILSVCVLAVGAAVGVAPAPSMVTNAASTSTADAPSTARITSRSTYYDRKEGVAHFSGDVFVDDKDYKLHADSAFVFLGTGGTNELSRIVALGHIALTNESRRAYGTKVSYYRQPGLVVLHGDAKTPAEVCEETPDGVRKVVGKKIKFWIGSEQVEVVEAVITAPTRGEIGDLKSLGR